MTIEQKIKMALAIMRVSVKLNLPVELERPHQT